METFIMKHVPRKPAEWVKWMLRALSWRKDSVVCHSFTNLIMADSLIRWTVDKLKHNFGLEASDDIVQ